MIRDPHVLRAAIAQAHVEELWEAARETDDVDELAAIAREVAVCRGSIERIAAEQREAYGEPETARLVASAVAFCAGVAIALAALARSIR